MCYDQGDSEQMEDSSLWVLNKIRNISDMYLFQNGEKKGH